MKNRLIFPIVAAALVFIASSDAQAGFGCLFGHHHGCGSCCEPACCAPACCEPACCEPAPCCEPCCDSCGCGHRHGLLRKLVGWLHNHCHKRSCCAPSCCEPSCCEPTCCGY